MNGDQFRKVLAYLTKSQNKTFDEFDAAIWDDALGDLPYGPTMEGLKALNRTTEKFITPASVRIAAQAEMAALLARAGEEPKPPSGLNTQEYLAYRRGWRDAVVSGSDPETAHAAAVEASNRVASLEPVPSRSQPHLPALTQVTGRPEIVEGEVVEG